MLYLVWYIGGCMRKGSLKRAKQRLLGLTIALFVIVVLVVASVFKDWTQIMENERLVTELSTRYSSLLNEETQLQSDVNKLQDPDYVARYAREKYLYTKEGELIIRIPKNS